MQYRSVLYGPVYQLHGVPADLTLRSGAIFPGLTALDKTSGVQLAAGLGQLETLRPMASMLVGDLLEAGIADPNLIDGGSLVLNGKTWTVNSIRMMPSPSGEGDGEVYLLLEGASG